MARASIPRLTFWLQATLALELTLLLAAATQRLGPQPLVQNTLAWVQDLGAIGVFAFVMFYNLATVFFIPGSLLTLGGGLLYGVFWGSIYVVFASILGATIAFLIGRYLARDWVCRRLQKYPKFQSIDSAVARDGAKVVLLTRLSPVFPFNLLNYAFGVTQISLRDYIVGSIGMVPGTVMYVYIGSLAGDLATLGASPDMSFQAQFMQWMMRGIGLVATVTVTLYITHIARKALNEEMSS